MSVDLKSVFHFANLAHKGQKRKYTGEDYIVHPISVARLVEKHGGSLDQQAAALLHDVVEDTPHTWPISMLYLDMILLN